MAHYVVNSLRISIENNVSTQCCPIHASRHHHLRAVPGDESDDSDEWDLEESEDEWEGPGDVMYRDYRRMQRSTFLIAHMRKREEEVREEMARWRRIMDRLMDLIGKEILSSEFGSQVRPPVAFSPAMSLSVVSCEEFGLDCHDLSLENVFVDPKDNSKIVSISFPPVFQALITIRRPVS